MQSSGVKVLHSKRTAIKQRLLQQNAILRDVERRGELDYRREHGTSSMRSEEDVYALIGAEFQCDVGDPEVMDLLLALEEEIQNERLLALFDESQEDWETYYRHLKST